MLATTALAAGSALAQTDYDFADTGNDGTVLYYKITGAQSVTVYGHRIDTSDATTVYVGALAIPDTVTHDGASYAVTAVGDSAFMEQSSITTVAFPATIREIGVGAFNFCMGLTAIDIPEGVTTINEKAFFFCREAATTDIPSTVEYIGSNAFRCVGSDVSGSSVTIHDAPCNISRNAFCAGAENIDLGDSVLSLGDGALASCCARSIALPSSLRHIGNFVFEGSVYLNRVTFPENMDTIPVGMFCGCMGLTSIEIPPTVTHISDSAFMYCFQLAGDIVLPEGLLSVGQHVFDDCMSIDRITSHAAEPPAAHNTSFSGISSGIPVYVPCGAGEAYAEAPGWSHFNDFREMCNAVENAYALSVTLSPSIASWTANVVSSFGMSMVEAYDMSGAIVHRQKADGLATTLDVRHWPTGTYLLRIHTPQGTAVKKLVVRR